MLAIVFPEAGVAEAANAMVSGATKVAPSVGAVSATAVGGVAPLGFTMKRTAGVVVVWPWLSWAVAKVTCTPGQGPGRCGAG